MRNHAHFGFHTPQGIGPLSTVNRAGFYERETKVSIPLRALDLCRQQYKAEIRQISVFAL